MSRTRRTSSRSSGGKTTGYVTIFEVKQGEDGKEYLQFTKNSDYVDIQVNGVSVNGKTIYVNDPAEKFEIMVKNGQMTEEEAEEKVSKIPDYVLEEATVKLG